MTASLRTLCCSFLAVAMLGCSGTSAPEEKPAETTTVTETAFNVDKLPTVELSVPDMMCETSCVPTVRKALAARQGVKEVKVDLESKIAVVAVDEKEFDADAAVADLVDLGFKETKLADKAPSLNPPAN